MDDELKSVRLPYLTTAIVNLLSREIQVAFAFRYGDAVKLLFRFLQHTIVEHVPPWVLVLQHQPIANPFYRPRTGCLVISPRSDEEIHAHGVVVVRFVHHLLQELHGPPVGADETQGNLLLHLDVHIAVVVLRTDYLAKSRHMRIFLAIERLDRNIERQGSQLVQIILQLGISALVALELREKYLHHDFLVRVYQLIAELRNEVLRRKQGQLVFRTGIVEDYILDGILHLNHDSHQRLQLRFRVLVAHHGNHDRLIHPRLFLFRQSVGHLLRYLLWQVLFTHTVSFPAPNVGQFPDICKPFMLS